MSSKTQTKKSTSDKETIVLVNGLEIKTKSIYKIEPKLDKSAPDGFIKAGTTKLPSEGIGNTVSCKYLDRENNKGIYDTGLYPQSPCYAGKSLEEKQNIVKNIRKYIVEPYEEVFGTAILDVTNKEFWDTFSIDLYDGRVFSTENVEDLLALFIAVNSFDLTPDSMIGSPSFNSSDFIIKDSDYSMSVAQRRIKDRFEAISNFGNLLNTNRNNLLAILRLLNIVSTSQNPTDLDLQSTFSIWLDKDVQNPETFILQFKEASEEGGMEKILLTVQVKKLIELKKLKREGTEFVHNGVPLGIDIKSVVNNLEKDPELSTIREEIRLM